MFVSLESSPEIVCEAFKLGAKGYVLKQDLGRDFLIGIDAVIEGETFISSSLERIQFTPMITQVAKV
jgi:DNA-binding NarL/FixJ family response regulator